MASNQPRPWFRLGSFVRPAQPPPPRPPAPTPAPQQPIVRPAAPQLRPPAPQPISPQEIAPPTPQRPAAASAPRSPPPPTAPAPRSPMAPSPAPPSVPAPRSPLRTLVAPSPPTIPLPRSPLRSPAASPPPTATAPRSPPAAPTPSSPAARTTTTSPTASPITKSPTSLQTSPSKKASSPAPSTTLAITSSSLPASPMRKVSAPSSYTTSPIIKPATPSRSPPPTEPPSTAVPTMTVTNHSHTPVSSPKTVKPLSKTPPQSPQVKPISHPPSPLTLPPAQIKAENDREPKIPTEIEQKTVVQETTEKPAKMMPRNANGYGQRHLSTNNKYFENDKGKDGQKKLSDSEEFGMRVITLAGENKGAIMELSPASRNKVGNRNGWSNGKKLGTDDASGNEEERSNMKDKSQKAMALESPPMTAFMNSNVQGVNNSILYNCACAHNDPGVHLSFTRKANGGHGNRLKDHTRD